MAGDQDIEAFERDRGNEEFKKGNFTAAVKCYTKCLGVKVHVCLSICLCLCEMYKDPHTLLDLCLTCHAIPRAGSAQYHMMPLIMDMIATQLHCLLQPSDGLSEASR